MSTWYVPDKTGCKTRKRLYRLLPPSKPKHIISYLTISAIKVEPTNERDIPACTISHINFLAVHISCFSFSNRMRSSGVAQGLTGRRRGKRARRIDNFRISARDLSNQKRL